jgi:1-deoxy-D-xylulose-5-phosphate synthase
MVLMAPKDHVEFRYMLRLAFEHKGPVAIRYPRGSTEATVVNEGILVPFKVGEAEIIRDGSDVVLFAMGNSVYSALSAAEKLERDNNIHAMVVNARFVKPLDRRLISSLAARIPKIITIEENVLQGGFGSSVLEFLNKAEIHRVKLRMLGLPDIFVEQGSQDELRKIYGLDAEGIYTAVLSIVKEPNYNL